MVENKLPAYINCQTNTEPCNYFLIKELCKDLCPYAKDIKGTNAIGIGAMTEVPGQNIPDDFGNMKYVNGKLNNAYQRK